MMIDPLVRRLVELREQAGLTQVELAERIGTSQPVIARLEAGARDPRLSTLRRIADAVGADLELHARQDPARMELPSATRLAERVRAQLERGRTTGAIFREVVQFLDDTADLEPPSLRLAIRVEPASTGDGRWDALVAAAVDWAASRGGIASPSWTRAPQRKLSAPGWVVTPYRALHALVRANAPAEFVRHGVYVDADSLESV